MLARLGLQMRWLFLALLLVVIAGASVSGASRAELTVTDQLDVDASGASRVRYAGTPEVGRLAVSDTSSSVEHDE
jgi:hypothetical protein